MVRFDRIVIWSFQVSWTHREERECLLKNKIFVPLNLILRPLIYGLSKLKTECILPPNDRNIGQFQPFVLLLYTQDSGLAGERELKQNDSCSWDWVRPSSSWPISFPIHLCDLSETLPNPHSSLQVPTKFLDNSNLVLVIDSMMKSWKLLLFLDC